MREQEMFRCTIMRGGTSKAVFIKQNELPAERKQQEKIILAILGSPDPRQIDGLGGSDITTSKVAIIAPSSRDDADLDYTFGQVQLTRPEIIWNANCGNISSAVGSYAIDEGMVKICEPLTKIRIHNTNTGRILLANVPVKNGKSMVGGDYILDSVPGSGARIDLDYRLTAGSVTGKLLPTGNPVDQLSVKGVGEISVSIVDIANCTCFIRAADLGLSGSESRPQLLNNQAVLERLEAVRSAAALAAGLAPANSNPTEVSPIQPMIAFVAPPANYKDYAGAKKIDASEIDFLARIVFNQLPVETYTGTGTICTAVAACIEDTVVNHIYRQHVKKEGQVSFGHARGINTIEVDVSHSGTGYEVNKAVFSRTARRIMDGCVYVKKTLLA